jgi:hypothetical protein
MWPTLPVLTLLLGQALSPTVNGKLLRFETKWDSADNRYFQSDGRSSGPDAGARGFWLADGGRGGSSALLMIDNTSKPIGDGSSRTFEGWSVRLKPGPIDGKLRTLRFLLSVETDNARGFSPVVVMFPNYQLSNGMQRVGFYELLVSRGTGLAPVPSVVMSSTVAAEDAAVPDPPLSLEYRSGWIMVSMRFSLNNFTAQTVLEKDGTTTQQTMRIDLHPNLKNFDEIFVGHKEYENSSGTYAGRYRLDEIATDGRDLPTRIAMVQSDAGTDCVPVRLEPHSPFVPGPVELIDGLDNTVNVEAMGGTLSLDPNCREEGSARLQLTADQTFFVRSPTGGEVTLSMDPPASYLASAPLTLNVPRVGSTGQKSIYGCTSANVGNLIGAALVGLWLLRLTRRKV